MVLSPSFLLDLLLLVYHGSQHTCSKVRCFRCELPQLLLTFSHQISTDVSNGKGILSYSYQDSVEIIES